MSMSSTALNAVRRTAAAVGASPALPVITRRAMSKTVKPSHNDAGTALQRQDFYRVQDSGPYTGRVAKKEVHHDGCGDVLTLPPTLAAFRTIHEQAIPGFDSTKEVVFELNPGHPPNKFDGFKISQKALGSQVLSSTTHDPCGGDPQPAIQKARTMRDDFIQHVTSHPDEYSHSFVRLGQTLENNGIHNVHFIDVIIKDGHAGIVPHKAALSYQAQFPHANFAVHEISSRPSPQESALASIRGLG